MARLYLDHAASTPLAAPARAAILEALSSIGHPSSAHEEGRRVHDRLEQARSLTARAWRCRPREVVFTASGTVAAQLALIGAATARRDRSRRVVLSGIEHPSIADAAPILRGRGFEVVEIPPGPDGRVDAEAFLAATDGGAAAASLIAANHETGVIQPTRDVAPQLRARGIPFVVDGCLAPGRLPSSRDHLDADLVALSAHKFGGPRGVGILVVKRGTQVASLWAGGLQEERLHAGTQAVALAAGAAAALDDALRLEDRRAGGYRATLDAFLAALSSVEGWRCVGDGAPLLPGIVTLEFARIEGEAAMINLDLEGVAVATGSACALGATEAARSLLAMGFTKRRAAGTLRISTGEGVSKNDAARAGHTLADIVRRLTRLAGRP